MTLAATYLEESLQTALGHSGWTPKAIFAGSRTIADSRPIRCWTSWVVRLRSSRQEAREAVGAGVQPARRPRPPTTCSTGRIILLRRRSWARQPIGSLRVLMITGDA